MLSYVLNDHYPSPTSILQAQTEDALAPLIPSKEEKASVSLNRNAHLQYLVKNMVHGLPAQFASFDASQSWLLFWTLQSFATLQVAMDPDNKQRAIDTIMSLQHPDGGFGGGPKQFPHLLPTYAAISALAAVGRPGPGGGWDQIDREKLYKFFMSLKQPDGSFRVSEFGEVDTRGTYGLLCVATLLNMLTPELVENTAFWITSCQGYEGGFSSDSYNGSYPHGESHGGYTYCGIAAYIMLEPFMPKEPSQRPILNTKSLLRWLVQLQGKPSEIGGFKGRVNKLVDGCYSWWVGGAFSLIENLGISFSQTPDASERSKEKGGDSHWVDHEDGFYDRVALQEYILCACQAPNGGLRDKPGKAPDPYHTVSCLSGLATAQSWVRKAPNRRRELEAAWKDNEKTASPFAKEIFLEALCYDEDKASKVVVGGSANRVNPMHPLFNLTMTHVESIMSWSYGQEIPPHKD